MGFSPTRTLTALALLLALPLGAQTPGQRGMDLPARENPALEGGGPDRPDLRRDWNLWWFGGKLSPAYLDYKNHLAVQEMRRWGALMPQTAGNKLLPAIIGAAAAPAGTGGTWVNLGPTANLTNATWPDIDSGRPSAIAVDPGSTTLYLATSGGGVWKCVNADPNAAGDWTWTPVTDGLPNSGSSGNVSVGALALSPASAQVVYLGLGDAFDAEGRGFYKSTDGGTNWTASTGIGAQTRSYFILAVDANVVLWGTNDGLKRSTDGGSTFAPVAGGPSTGQVWSVQAFSATELVCSGQDSNGTGSIYYSSDAGASWTKATLGGLGTITPGRMTLTSVPSGTTGYAEVEDTTAAKVGRGVLMTGDKGHTWNWQAAATEAGGLFQGTQVSGDGGQAWYNHAIAVDPTNPNRLIMGANLAIYRSTNGGANWQQLTQWYGSGHVYSHADFHTVTYKGGLFYVGNDGGLSIFKDPWRTTIPTSTPDLSFMDNTRNKGLATHLVYNVGSTTATTSTDAKYRVTLGLQDNGTRVRQGVGSGLATSSTFEDQIGGDGFATLINPVDGNQMLGSIYYTQIYKSTNGGTSQFTPSSSGITESNNSSKAPFQPRLAQGDTADPNTVYTATNGTVYKSTDFGSSWSALSTTNLPPGGTGASTDPATALYIRNIGAAAGNANALGIVANQGRVYLSYNGGTSWNQGGTLTNNGSYTSSIWFDRANSQIVYVASVAPDATKNHLWKSINGGASWTAIDGSATTSNGLPFGIPVHVVLTDPLNASKVYAGTDFGVYFSTDGGTSWNRFGSNLPLVAVRDLYIAPDDGFLRAATFGRGVWELQTAASASPAITLAPTAVTMINGGTQTFTPSVTNGTANTVTWTASSGTIGAGPTASGTPQTYTAPASGASATVTAATVDTPIATTSATVTLVSPAAVSVTVTPATVEMLTGTSTQQFSATVSPLTSQSVTWSGTGVNASGLFSAATLAAGSYTVRATSAASPTSAPGTATVTLVSPSSVTVTVAPATATTAVGSSLQFTATVAGLSAANQGVTWTVNGGGSISTSGLFTASTPGSFTVTATNSFSSVAGTATVTVKTLDLNGDGTVDQRDLLFFAKYYGTANAACDLNGDGIVDDKDLGILLGGL